MTPNTEPLESRMMRRSVRIVGVIAVAIVTTALIAPIALGNAGSGATTTVLGHRATLWSAIQVNEDRIKFQTKDATDIQTQTITFIPGGFSGWHHHPGVILVVVESGTVTVHDENCQTLTFGPHESFIEGGPGAMMVSNQGSVNAVVYATQVAPAGSAFRLEDDPPPCAG